MPAEQKLQEYLIHHPPSPFTMLVAREWPVHGISVGKKQVVGRGDLVFADTKSKDEFLVVEAKASSAKRRISGRAKVVQHALRYGVAWHKKLSIDDNHGLQNRSVRFGILTSDDPKKSNCLVASKNCDHLCAAVMTFLNFFPEIR
jgi:hypothetical protein